MGRADEERLAIGIVQIVARLILNENRVIAANHLK